MVFDAHKFFVCSQKIRVKRKLAGLEAKHKAGELLFHMEADSKYRLFRQAIMISASCTVSLEKESLAQAPSNSHARNTLSGRCI